MQNTTQNIIIIGSGPAGLTAALYAARANLKPLLFEGEEAGGQLMITTDVENYPGFPDGVTGPDLIHVFRQQAEKFGTQFITKNITKVDFSQRPFKVWVGDQCYQAEAVIVSTGASAKFLGLESEKQFMGKGVSACATCDGAFFKDVIVGVVGGGDTAMEEALFLTRFASKVVVIHRRDQFRSSKIMADRVMNHEKIEVLWNKEVINVFGEDLMKGVKLKDTVTKDESEVSMEGLFIAIGHKPNTGIFVGHLEMQETGYLKTKADSSYTNVEGVFACGDVQDHIYRQAITAAGTGCMAAIDAERWLETNAHN